MYTAHERNSTTANSFYAHIGTLEMTKIVNKEWYNKTYSNPYRGLEMSYRIKEVKATRISRKLAHEGGKIVSPAQRPHLPPGDTAGTHFC